MQAAYTAIAESIDGVLLVEGFAEVVTTDVLVGAAVVTGGVVGDAVDVELRGLGTDKCCVDPLQAATQTGNSARVSHW